MPAPGWMRSMRGMPLVSNIGSQISNLKFDISNPNLQISNLKFQITILKPERSRSPQSQRRVNSRDPIIRHDSQAAGERFGLPRGERLPNIEDPKKYKAQQKIFPVDRERPR